MHIKVVGHQGSPYSVKLRAFLRYKRIPFNWIHSNTNEATSLPPTRVPIIPAVYFADERFSSGHTDSTPLIQFINHKYLERSSIPPDPVLRFLNELFEDFADEWLNKLMFYYRFKFDGAFNSQCLLLSTDPSMSINDVEQFAKIFEMRQKDKMKTIVSIDEKSQYFVEDYDTRILKVFDEILSKNNYIFGSRPSSSDFGFYGQFHQLLLSDPASSTIALNSTKRLIPWCSLMEDLSGIDIENRTWITREFLKLSKPHIELLKDVQDIYLKLLNSNLIASNDATKEFTVNLRGHLWKQCVNKYHVKCLMKLRESYELLSPEDKKFIISLGLMLHPNKSTQSQL